MPHPETSWKIYDKNEEAWEAMIADCKKAKKIIVLETLIFVTDEYGQRLIDVCAERAAAGVKVRFLWDAWGSFSFFGSSIVTDLKKKGIELIFWKTIIPNYYKASNFRSWFFRNHRRTLVIDETVGYTGSMCVADRMKDWRDTNLRVEGPVVAEMENAFDRMWARALDIKPLPRRVRVRNHEFRYMTNFPAPGRRHIYAELVEAIRHARKYIYMTTPYFVPTRRLSRVLRLAAHRGVDVRIIMPQASNHPFVDLAARTFFTSILSAGVRIFLYQGEHIHGKTTVIDGDWGSIGTMNMDAISLLYNFEANIVSTNATFAEEMASHFVHDLQKAKELSLEEWERRSFIQKWVEFPARLVRKFL
jgi:cardiolipin synthase A/B